MNTKNEVSSSEACEQCAMMLEELGKAIEKADNQTAYLKSLLAGE